MAKQRVLILSPDPGSIDRIVREPSLAGIHVTVYEEW